MASEDACEHDMLVQIRWQGRKVAVPLFQLLDTSLTGKRYSPRSGRINR